MTSNRTYHRPRRSDEALKHSWRYIYYEHEMLEMSADWIIEHLNADVTGYEFAVYMESFLVHARNLNEFYHAQTNYREGNRPRPPRNDDIIAEDFFDDLTAWNPPPATRLSDELISRINQRLAHLTYHRTLGNRNDYDYADIYNKLTAAREAFLKIAPPTRLDLSEFNFWYLPPTFWEDRNDDIAKKLSN